MNIVISLFSPVVKQESDSKGVLCFYEGVINSLSKLGNRVFVHITSDFNIENSEIPETLLREIEDFNPDLFILFNNTFYEIPSRFTCPIVIWEVDSPAYYSNKEVIRKSPSRYKFIVCQEESIAELKEYYGVDKKNVLLCPFFTEVQAEKMENATNIVFIGSFFGGNSINPFADFWKTNPSQDEVLAYKRLLSVYAQNPHLNIEELVSRAGNIPESVLQSVHLVKWETSLSAFNRVKTLSAVADLGITIYGTRTWAVGNYLEPWLTLSYNPRLLYTLKHNQDAYNSAKIGININHLQARSGFSWRVCDIMASNACLVSEYRPNFDKYFADIGLPYFDNPYDARTICKQLLTDENYRLDLVRASQQVIDKNFRFANVQCLLEQFLDMSFISPSTEGQEGEVIYRIAGKLSFLKRLKKKIKKYSKKLKHS